MTDPDERLAALRQTISDRDRTILERDRLLAELQTELRRIQESFARLDGLDPCMTRH